jgi:excisionase family DNA binding protein
LKENKDISKSNDQSKVKIDSIQKLGQSQFWNSDIASEYLKVSKSYLYSLVRAKLVPHYRPIEGGKIWFLESDLFQWLIGSKVEVEEKTSGWTEDEQRKFIRSQLSS